MQGIAGSESEEDDIELSHSMAQRVVIFLMFKAFIEINPGVIYCVLQTSLLFSVWLARSNA